MIEATSAVAEDLALQVIGLSYCYPNNTSMTLQDINLSVQRGERLALIGPNGAGKSTLLLHLNGLLPIQRGKISVARLTMNRSNLHQIRSLVGLVFQNPDDQLFMPTLIEDVTFGLLNMGLETNDALCRARRALQLVGLSDLEERPPFHLSVGEKKRAALAGILAMEPSILILDEPSSALDPRGRRKLIELISQLKHITCLIATHDLELTLELCERAVIIEQGQIAADGPTPQLLSDPQLMARHGLEVPYSLRCSCRL